MIVKMSCGAFILSLSCAACVGQTSFQGLTPGVSTRDEVARVLGQPVRTGGTTPFEYHPPTGIAKVEVEYRAGSYTIQRIAVYIPKPISRSALLRKFSLPQQADKSTMNSNGQLIEYFGGAALLDLIYASADPGSGVSRIDYYSRELFTSMAGNLKGIEPHLMGTPGENRKGPPIPTDTASKNTGSARVCFSNPGAAVLDSQTHYEFALRLNQTDLENNLLDKMRKLYDCQSMTDARRTTFFADVSILIAKRFQDVRCFNGDVGVINPDWNGHKNAWNGRPQSKWLENLTWKTSRAIRCMSKDDQASFFSAVSMTIASALDRDTGPAMGAGGKPEAPNIQLATPESGGSVFRPSAGNTEGLAQYVGTYDLSTIPGAPWRSATVESSSGRLYLVTSSGRFALARVPSDQGISASGPMRMEQFRVEGGPGGTIMFFLSGGRAQQVIYMQNGVTR